MQPLTNIFLDLFFPITCVVCKKEKTHCCTDCFVKECAPAPIEENTRSRFAFDRLLAGRPIKEHTPFAELVHRLKYDGSKEITTLLTPLLIAGAIAHIQSTFPRKFMLTPVPLHPQRFRWRGFNQSLLLAKALGKTLELPVGDILRRRRYTQPQVELEKQSRITNMRDAFVLKIGAKIEQEKTYVLIDDVATTGSTLNECAKALRKGGATSVIAAVVGRA